MSGMDLGTILLNAQSQDLNVRNLAEQQLAHWEAQSLPQFMIGLANDSQGRATMKVRVNLRAFT
jgi:importin subunit beta-1